MSHFLALTSAAAVAAKTPKPGDWSFGWAGVASIAAAALAIVICLWILSSYLAAERERNKNSPWRLFADLCKAHKLSRRERSIVHRLAQQLQLEQPAILFVEPTWYCAEKVGPSWDQCGEDLDRLRQRLFASH
jgi:hypothetical protein